MCSGRFQGAPGSLGGSVEASVSESGDLCSFSPKGLPSGASPPFVAVFRGKLEVGVQLGLWKALPAVTWGVSMGRRGWSWRGWGSRGPEVKAACTRTFPSTCHWGCCGNPVGTTSRLGVLMT